MKRKKSKRAFYVFPGQCKLFELPLLKPFTSIRDAMPKKKGLYEIRDIDGKEALSFFSDTLGMFQNVTHRPVAAWREMDHDISYHEERATCLYEIISYQSPLYRNDRSYIHVESLLKAAICKKPKDYFCLADSIARSSDKELRKAIDIMIRFPEKMKERKRLCERELALRNKNNKHIFKNTEELEEEQRRNKADAAQKTA